MAFIQEKISQADAAVTSPGVITTITFDSAINDGDTLFGVVVGANAAVNAGFDVDDMTATYNGSPCVLLVCLGGIAIKKLGAAAASAGAGVITLNYTGSGTNVGVSYIKVHMTHRDPTGDINIFQGSYQGSVSGKASADALRSDGAGEGNASTVGGSNVTTVDGCEILCFGFGQPYTDYTFTAGTGFTMRGTPYAFGGGVSGISFFEDKIQTTAGATLGSFQETSGHSAVDAMYTNMFALEPSGGGGPTTVTLSGSVAGTTGTPSGLMTATLNSTATADVEVTLGGTNGTVTFDPNPIVIAIGEISGTSVPNADTDGTHVVTETNDSGLTDTGSVNYTTNQLVGGPSSAARGRLVNAGGQ